MNVNNLVSTTPCEMG